MIMEWISIKDQLPPDGEDVLVWMKYKGKRSFEWNDSVIIEPEYTQAYDYVEPNSKRVWSMGSARGYKITHWMRIERP